MSAPGSSSPSGAGDDVNDRSCPHFTPLNTADPEEAKRLAEKCIETAPGPAITLRQMELHMQHELAFNIIENSTTHSMNRWASTTFEKCLPKIHIQAEGHWPTKEHAAQIIDWFRVIILDLMNKHRSDPENNLKQMRHVIHAAATPGAPGPAITLQEMDLHVQHQLAFNIIQNLTTHSMNRWVLTTFEKCLPGIYIRPDGQWPTKEHAAQIIDWFRVIILDLMNKHRLKNNLPLMRHDDFKFENNVDNKITCTITITPKQSASP